mgnify:FL=1
MNSEQKDSMLHDILMQVKCRIVYLVSRDMIDESVALYKEWEEHFNDDVTELEIITINDLTTI